MLVGSEVLSLVDNDSLCEPLLDAGWLWDSLIENEVLSDVLVGNEVLSLVDNDSLCETLVDAG